jgi:hypothetical protein
MTLNVFFSEGYWTNRERSGYGMFLVMLKGVGDPIGSCGMLHRKVLDVTDIGFGALLLLRSPAYGSIRCVF